ncbi:AbrB/MazE/SpoVT family DNA-binding domain-containing protein [Candidatus Woesearchaeota archaeon]|nr:AbrB/MazE/SpoVT family DNA-binding domain-containing protein [Candidatus Woesearchaeota archaeon]
MVSIAHKTKMGPKGQVVIPKLIRESFGMDPGSDIVIECADNKVFVSRNTSDIVKAAEKIAKGRTNRLSPRKMREMAAEERWRFT